MRFNFRPFSRIRFGYAMAALLLAAFAVLAQTPPIETQKLTLNQPIERQIKGGETHSFQFNLKAGEYARVEVIEQKDINVAISLFDSTGKLFAEMSNIDNRRWREALSVIAETGDNYRVEIKGNGESDEKGSYTVQIVEQRKLMPKDQQRIEAERHLSAAREFIFKSSKAKYEANLELAVKEYESAVKLWRELNERYWEGVTLAAQGNIYKFLSNGDLPCSKVFEQAAAIFRETKLGIEEGYAERESGDAFRRLKQFQKAKQHYEQALITEKGNKNRRGEAASLLSLGFLHEESEQSEKASEYYEQSLATLHEINDFKNEIYTLSRIGFECFYIFERYGKALKFYDRSYLLAQENKEWKSAIRTLISLSHLYLNFNNSEKGREYIEKAVALSQKDGTLLNGETTYRDLGIIYWQLKEYEKARHYLEKNLEQQIKDKFLVGEALNKLAELYKDQKQYDKAHEYLDRVVKFAKENSNGESEDFMFSEYGNLYQQQKQYDKAREYYEKALVISLKSKSQYSKYFEAYNLLDLGRLYLELKQYEKAREYLELTFAKMPDIFSQYRIMSQSEIAQISTTMVELWDGLKNPQLAIFYGKQAVNAYQNIRRELKSFDKDTQRNFVKDIEPIYRRLADLLISEGRLPEAQTVLDLLKEQEFKNVVPRRSGETPDTVPYSQAEASVSSSIENLAKLERERSDLLKQKEAGALSAAQQTRLDRIPVEIEAANKAFRLALDALGKAETGSANRVAEIQSEKSLQRALQTLNRETDSEVVALYTVLGNEQTGDGGKAKTKFGWVILVTPTSRKAYPIDVSDLEQTVFQFRDALSSDRYDPKPAAQKLYAKLFRQSSPKQKTTLEADLQTLFGDSTKNKTLMWSLDGILRYVPMAALHDGNNYLAEKYGSVIFTKESFLTLTEKDAVKWNALGLGVSEKRENFNALPGAERELKDIVRLPRETTGIVDGAIRLNKDFSKDATLKLWREGAFPLVHIASHYAFNATDPTSSFLLVGDGQLSFSEMQDSDNLFGAIDLLTLSACDTAISGNGKEAEGFAYLAQSLGAKSVIASLWKVSDAGTPELMVRFYRIHQQNPQMPKGEAFRQAQISLLGSAQKAEEKSNAKRSEIVDISGKKIELPLFVKDEKKPFAHPHYWSSFVLIGNWR